MSRFLSRDEISQIGLASYGTDVSIDRTVIFINPGAITLGRNVRIDAYALLSAGSAGIHIGNYIHISFGASIFGGGGQVLLEDFVNISGRVSIYTASDDPVESHLVGPCVPDRFRCVHTGSVTLRSHSQVGAASVLLPGVELGFGSAVGAMSLVHKDVDECTMVQGNPARKLVTRRCRALLEKLGQELMVLPPTEN